MGERPPRERAPNPNLSRQYWSSAHHGYLETFPTRRKRSSKRVRLHRGMAHAILIPIAPGARLPRTRNEPNGRASGVPARWPTPVSERRMRHANLSRNDSLPTLELRRLHHSCHARLANTAQRANPPPDGPTSGSHSAQDHTSELQSPYVISY